MDVPHGSVDDADALDEDVLAAIRLNKVGPKVASIAEDPVANRDATGRHLVEPRTRAGWRIRNGMPGPPVFVAGLAIECAAASDRDVCLFEGIDERRVVHQF